MTSADLKAALEEARRKLAEAVEAQNQIGFEVNRLQNLVRTLAANVWNAERNEQMQAQMQYELGIMEAIEGIINGSQKPLNPLEVMRTLRFYGYDIDRFANPNAMVHQTLSRLAQAQRIKTHRGLFMRNDFNQWLLG